MEKSVDNQPKTVLGYHLNSRQNVILNYLLPSILACFLYIFVIATDIGVIFRHHKDRDPIWASLTLFFMYLPALGSFIIIVTDWDYWPEPEKGITSENVWWFNKKVFGHLFFPVWSMWRFAERIFWAIEATISTNQGTVEEAVSRARERRLIELYVFLQSYLHSLPQVLLQLHILMRHNADIAQESKNVQALSILLNLAEVAVTTTYYQRFKAQKVIGSEYPWMKKKKLARIKGVPLQNEEHEVILRNSSASQRRVIEKQKSNVDDLIRHYDVEPPVLMERRRSSDIYLEPEPLELETAPHTLEGQQGNPLNYNITGTPDAATSKPFNFVIPDRSSYIARFSSLFGMGKTTVPDSFSRISRVKYIKGLPEDDIAGKAVSFLWWFTFLLGRTLAISVFAYFYLNACTWLLVSHIVIVIAALLYDVKTDHIKRDKTVFFLFIGVLYIFCIIEFKIRFKKTNFIYIAYFGLVFLENGIMCVVWYCNELESLENDYWFRYIFFTVVLSDLLSLSSMIFYHILTKPKSVSVRVTS